MNRPKLLVSVRSATEAKSLVGSACDIVDVKEPSRGPLGMADRDVIAAIAEVLPKDQVLSVALGEVFDQREAFDVPKRVSFLKLGLSELSDSDWAGRWLDARSKAQSIFASWVAVAYADHSEAGSPSPRSVFEAGVESDCGVFLIDTFAKRPGESVFDVLSVSELQELRDEAVSAGIQFALAGQLRARHAEKILEVAPDIVGIRGAACRASNRQSEIDRVLVDKFAAAILGDRIST